MAFLFRKDDIIKIMSGKNRGTISKVKKVLPKKNKVIVKNYSKIKKSIKPSEKNKKGKIKEEESAISASNLMHYIKNSYLTSRVGFKKTKDQKKVRFYKKTGNIIINELS